MSVGKAFFLEYSRTIGFFPARISVALGGSGDSGSRFGAVGNRSVLGIASMESAHYRLSD